MCAAISTLGCRAHVVDNAGLAPRVPVEVELVRERRVVDAPAVPHAAPHRGQRHAPQRRSAAAAAIIREREMGREAPQLCQMP